MALSRFAKVRLDRLTTGQVTAWHGTLARTASRRRRADADEADGRRARRATANRLLTIFRALLNHAWRGGYVRGDSAWRKVAPFKGATASRMRYLRSRRSGG